MSKTLISYFAFLLILVSTSAFGQIDRQDDIVKIAYVKIYGGPYADMYQIRMNIDAKGFVKMFNNVYDSSAAKKMTSVIERGSGSISIEELKSVVDDEPITSYYTGKLTNTEYTELTSLIMQVNEDTAKYSHGCFAFDTPFEGFKVFYKGGKRKYILCDFKQHSTISPVLDKLNRIALKRGYRQSTTRLNIARVL